MTKRNDLFILVFPPFEKAIRKLSVATRKRHSALGLGKRFVGKADRRTGSYAFGRGSRRIRDFEYGSVENEVNRRL